MSHFKNLNLNLAPIKFTSEKWQHILRMLQIRSTFNTDSFLHKLHCKPKDWGTTEDKNSIVYEIDHSICEVVYFIESKQSLKLQPDENKKSVKKLRS